MADEPRRSNAHEIAAPPHAVADIGVEGVGGRGFGIVGAFGGVALGGGQVCAAAVGVDRLDDRLAQGGRGERIFFALRLCISVDEARCELEDQRHYAEDFVE